MEEDMINYFFFLFFFVPIASLRYPLLPPLEPIQDWYPPLSSVPCKRANPLWYTTIPNDTIREQLHLPHDIEE